jgi:hypothetical protein
MEETVLPVSIWERRLPRGWWRPIGLWWVLWFLQPQSRMFRLPPCKQVRFCLFYYHVPSTLSSLFIDCQPWHL